MRVTFFSNQSKCDVDWRYPAKISEKNFCFLDNCNWVGCCNFFLLWRHYCSSTVILLTNTPRISDTLRRIFSNSVFAIVMKQYDHSALVHFFRPFNILTVKRCSETRFFRYLSNFIFRSLWFRKYIIYEGHLFVQNVHLKFPLQFLSKWWNNMMEALWCSFSECLIRSLS